MPFELLANYAELVRSYHFVEMLPVAVSQSPMGTQVNNSMVYHQPVGVCGLIPTWNFPFFVTAQKIGPALATGCTMVIKPSPYMPLLDLLIAEAVEECDLPPGVFNVVTGDGPELGAALVESPLVDKISFTGSAVTGKRIMAAAAPTLKRVHLELGGKSAAIVLDDVDLDQVAPYASTPGLLPRRPGLRDVHAAARPQAQAGRAGRAARHVPHQRDHGRRPGRSVGDARPGHPRGAPAEDRGVHRRPARPKARG